MIATGITHYVVDASLVIGALHLVFHPKPLTVFETQVSALAWFGVSILSYYLLGHAHMTERTWLYAAGLGYLYILVWCAETLNHLKKHNDLHDR